MNIFAVSLMYTNTQVFTQLIWRGAKHPQPIINYKSEIRARLWRQAEDNAEPHPEARLRYLLCTAPKLAILNKAM